MMPGFVQVDRHVFLAKVWPQIKRDVEAVDSNWKAAKEEGARPLIIEWGHKDKNTGEKIILAITRADDDKDEHWVDSHILSRLTKNRRGKG